MILVVTISCLLIIPSIWCYSPAMLVNLKYNSNIDINNFDKPALFICNFYDDEHHLDQILVCQEAVNTKLKLNIISLHDEADRLSRFMKKLPLFPKYNLLYTKNNVIEKCKEKLKDQHVWLFLKEDWNNKGAYHILKETNVPIVFVKFKYDNNRKKTFNRKTEIEYKLVEKYPIEKDADDFMKYIKSELYN